MGIRTPDLLIANETLYQLSYDPTRGTRCRVVGHPDGLRKPGFLIGDAEFGGLSVFSCRQSVARRRLQSQLAPAFGVRSPVIAFNQANFPPRPSTSSEVSGPTVVHTNP